MKFYALGLDENGRSMASYVDVPIHKVSQTEEISEKQEGGVWRIGFRNITTASRTNPNFAAPGGQYEMHVGGPPHWVGVMSGHAEITLQDGSAWRLCAGEFHYVAPGSLHHSNNPSLVPVTIFNLSLTGTPKDTQPYRFK